MNLLRHIVPVLALVFLCGYTLFADNGEANAGKNISPASHALSLKHDEQLAQLFNKVDDTRAKHNFIPLASLPDPNMQPRTSLTASTV